MTTEHVALPVPCAGCGTLTPYETTDQPGVGSFGEFLATPLGFCFVRTCWTHACVRTARAKVDGKPYTPPRAPSETLATGAADA